MRPHTIQFSKSYPHSKKFVLDLLFNHFFSRRCGGLTSRPVLGVFSWRGDLRGAMHEAPINIETRQTQ